MSSSYGHIKYKIIKKLRTRAVIMGERAKTSEEKKAWSEVVKWFDSFFKPWERNLSKHGSICASISNKEMWDRMDKENELLTQSITGEKTK